MLCVVRYDLTSRWQLLLGFIQANSEPDRSTSALWAMDERSAASTCQFGRHKLSLRLYGFRQPLLAHRRAVRYFLVSFTWNCEFVVLSWPFVSVPSDDFWIKLKIYMMRLVAIFWLKVVVISTTVEAATTCETVGKWTSTTNTALAWVSEIWLLVEVWFRV